MARKAYPPSQPTPEEYEAAWSEMVKRTMRSGIPQEPTLPTYSPYEPQKKNTLRQLIEEHDSDPRTPRDKDKELEMAVKALLTDEEPKPGSNSKKDKLLVQLRHELNQGQEALGDVHYAITGIRDVLKTAGLPTITRDRLERILARLEKKK